MCIKETIFGQVIAKSNNYQAVADKSNGGRRIIKNNEIRQYERLFASQCVIYRNRRINSKFRLNIVVFYKSARFDFDNSLKTVLDCLQQVDAITNDNLCTEIHAEKKIDKYNPRVVFSIEEIEPHLFNEYSANG